MNLILITTSAGGSPVRRSLHATHQFVVVGLACAVLLGGIAAGGYYVGRWQGTTGNAAFYQERLAKKEQELAAVRREAQAEVNALTARLAELQSRVTRLDALGRKLVSASNLDADEFDFDATPGMGGLLHEADDDSALRASELSEAIAALGERISDRERQLSVLQDVLMDRELAAKTTPAGEPIGKGWMSSSYGYRKDPFTGKRAWHDGVDFAGREGSPIMAVAGGVVSYAGKRWGYGRLVEITHGNGYVTRYGHNSKITVEEGQIVRRGDKIAEMGSSGRSTGPHVHLEVLKNGEAVNPWKYVQAEK
ncbi:MAG: peptidoglycan DD-metalloendopeptidase family protein [Halofilum sp. (in: g-proteobacteria)]|nr:peptidoglycan DD-metalloendopeptidase family protein [Halofilum sp. (in: g-proteobacteria)]